MRLLLIIASFQLLATTDLCVKIKGTYLPALAKIGVMLGQDDCQQARTIEKKFLAWRNQRHQRVLWFSTKETPPFLHYLRTPVQVVPARDLASFDRQLAKGVDLVITDESFAKVVHQRSWELAQPSLIMAVPPAKQHPFAYYLSPAREDYAKAMAKLSRANTIVYDPQDNWAWQMAQLIRNERPVVLRAVSSMDASSYEQALAGVDGSIISLISPENFPYLLRMLQYLGKEKLAIFSDFRLRSPELSDLASSHNINIVDSIGHLRRLPPEIQNYLSIRDPYFFHDMARLDQELLAYRAAQVIGTMMTDRQTPLLNWVRKLRDLQIDSNDGFASRVFQGQHLNWTFLSLRLNRHGLSVE